MEGKLFVYVQYCYLKVWKKKKLYPKYFALNNIYG